MSPKASSTHPMPIWCGRLKISLVGKSVGSRILLSSQTSYHRHDITEIMLLWCKTTTNKQTRLQCMYVCRVSREPVVGYPLRFLPLSGIWMVWSVVWPVVWVVRWLLYYWWPQNLGYIGLNPSSHGSRAVLTTTHTITTSEHNLFSFDCSFYE